MGNVGVTGGRRRVGVSTGGRGGRWRGGGRRRAAKSGELCLNRVAEGACDAVRVGHGQKRGVGNVGVHGRAAARWGGVGWRGGQWRGGGGQEAAKSGEWCP